MEGEDNSLLTWGETIPYHHSNQMSKKIKRMREFHLLTNSGASFMQPHRDKRALWVMHYFTSSYESSEIHAPLGKCATSWKEVKNYRCKVQDSLSFVSGDHHLFKVRRKKEKGRRNREAFFPLQMRSRTVRSPIGLGRWWNTGSSYLVYTRSRSSCPEVRFQRGKPHRNVKSELPSLYSIDRDGKKKSHRLRELVSTLWGGRQARSRNLKPGFFSVHVQGSPTDCYLNANAALPVQ